MPQNVTYLVLKIGDPFNTYESVFSETTHAGPFYLERESWAPAIAGRRRSKLTGLTDYNDVLEEITVLVKGTTIAAVLEGCKQLANYLDQADRFSAGEDVYPIWLDYVPIGSNVTEADPYRAMVLGRASGDETSGVTLPIDFLDTPRWRYARRVRLRFWRRGLWLGPEAASNSIASVDSSSFVAPTFANSTALPSPTRLELALGASQTTQEYGQGFVAIGYPIKAVYVANITGGTSTAEAAGNNAVNNVVRRRSHTTNSQTGTFTCTASVTDFPTVRRMQIIASLRANTGSVWQITPSISTPAGVRVGETVPWTASGDPEMVYLGEIALPNGVINAAGNVSIAPIGTNTAASFGGTIVFDVNAINLIGDGTVLRYEERLASSTGTVTGAKLAVDHSLLTRYQSYAAIVHSISGGSDIEHPLVTQGERVLTTRLNTNSFFGWFACANDNWRQHQSSTSTGLAVGTLTAYRREAFLVPV